MLKIDYYQRIHLQNKKNLDTLVEQCINNLHLEINHESYQFEVEDSEDEEIFIDDCLVVKYQGITTKIPTKTLELQSLCQLFNGLTLDQDNLTELYQYLPDGSDKDELIKELISGDQCFHFGHPLNIFQNKLKIGFFTNNMITCQKLDREVSNNVLAEYYLSLGDYLVKDQQRFMSIKQRRRRLLDKNEYLLSDDESQNNEQGVRKYIKLQSSADEVESTQSSQSQSPMHIQQVQQHQPYMSMIPSAQSLFSTTPIMALPPLNSTSITTNQMTLALMQAKKQIKQQSKTCNQAMNESNVPNGQSNREWLEYYWKQEKDRYGNPLQPFTYISVDNSKVTVGPVAKKLLQGVSQKPRQHELLKNERPTYVTILSLVRDASARLPKGFGTRADIVNLVKDSQWINESLAEDKMSSIISGALDRLHQSNDPCVKYDQEKKIWMQTSNKPQIFAPRSGLIISRLVGSYPSQKQFPEETKN